jgi:hydrogenase-1 operon protein HyaE
MIELQHNGGTEATDARERLRTVLDRLSTRHGFVALDTASYEDFRRAPGSAAVLFLDDPAREPEVWDAVIVLPEVVAAAREALRVGYLDPGSAERLMPRYGLKRRPALLVLRAGEYLGAIEGMRDYREYVIRLRDLMGRAPSRPPTIGIPVRALGAGAAASCAVPGPGDHP